LKNLLCEPKPKKTKTFRHFFKTENLKLRFFLSCIFFTIQDSPLFKADYERGLLPKRTPQFSGRAIRKMILSYSIAFCHRNQ
jgi:hypothetical protein